MIKWNTGRYIYDNCRNFTYLNGFKNINESIYDIWKHLHTYSDSYYQNAYYRDFSKLKESFITHLDNMFEFLNLLENTDNDEELSEKSLSLFQNDAVRSIEVIDILEVKRAQLLVDYCKSIHVLFSAIHNLENDDVSIDLEKEICEILDTKGLNMFQIPEELLINQQQINQTV